AARLAGRGRRGARRAPCRDRGLRRRASGITHARACRERVAPLGEAPVARGHRRPGRIPSRVRLVHVLSENWTLTPPRYLPALGRMAQEAEDAGFDAVMV